MKLKTRVFDIYNGQYRDLSELARAMRISVSQIYRVRQGKRPVQEKFIIGATEAFPGYKLDDLFLLTQTGARMTADNRNDLGKILKQRRVMIPLTLLELGRAAYVSSSHLGRIERGERFPSARILQRLAKPLGFEESELLTLAGYMTPQPSTEVERPSNVRLDPYVAMVLSQEPVEIQRAVVAILTVLKSVANTLHKKKEA